MYYLDGDVELDKALEINGDVTLCLHEHKLELKVPDGTLSPVIKVDGQGAVLTLLDKASNGGEITGGTHSGIYLVNKASSIMNGGKIANNKRSDDTSTDIADVDGYYYFGGGGVEVKNSAFTMTGGTITGNTVEGISSGAYGGGGVYVDDNSTFTMTGGTITGNTSNHMGGGVYVDDNSTFTMTGGTITSNTTDSGGGGVYNEGEFTMTDSDITGNTAFDGGGVYNEGEFTMTDSTISGNTAVEGGGVYNDVNDSTFTMTDSTISGNTATDGGGVWNDGTFTMTDSTISGNTATDGNDGDGSAGGVWNYGPFTMTDSTITGNTADYYGGVFSYNDIFTMNGGTISNNSEKCSNGEIGGNVSIVNISISGSPNITGNFSSDDKNIVNVYLWEDTIVSVISALGQNAKIGVTVENPPTEDNPVPIAEGDGYTLTEANVANFVSDDAQYKVTFDGGIIYLEKRSENDRTVTFDSQGGSAVSSQTVTVGEKAKKPADPTKDGSDFGGWYTNKDCTEGNEWDFDTDTVTTDITLYAKWTETTTPEAPKFTVTFNSNGGSTVNPQQVEKDKTVPKPTDPTRSGYTFDAWYKESACTNKWDFGTDTVTENITLYAKWTEKVTYPIIKYYTVTFETNGGSEIANQTIASGKTATMPQTPTKNGYEFLGWFTDEDFNEVYRFATPVTEDITIYAKWKSDDYIVTFDSNGGSNVTSQTVENGKTATIPQDPTRSGYEFLGWFTDEDFNEVYRFTTPVTEDITIYAKWKSKSRSSGGGGGGSSSGRTGTWVKEEPKTTQTIVQPEPATQYETVKQGCPRNETCPLFKFTDVDRWAWYHDGSHYCVEHNLIVGTTNTTFSPNMPITRAMVVAILWRIENNPLVNDVVSFQDVKENAYYTEAVRWAAHNGIVSGYSSNVFAPNDNITREQMASILYRYTQYKNKDVSGRADISNYQDRNEISNYALTAMQWACDAGIINGISTTVLSPKGTTTRAQVAQMIKSYLE